MARLRDGDNWCREVLGLLQEEIENLVRGLASHPEHPMSLVGDRSEGVIRIAWAGGQREIRLECDPIPAGRGRILSPGPAGNDSLFLRRISLNEAGVSGKIDDANGKTLGYIALRDPGCREANVDAARATLSHFLPWLRWRAGQVPQE